jgi:putative hydrolase of the HAD superfamily
MPAIRAVLFDLWGTLIVDDPADHEATRHLRAKMTSEALGALGFRYTVADILASFTPALEEHTALHNAEQDLSARGRTVLYIRHINEALPDRLDDRAWDLLDEAILTPKLSFRPLAMPSARDALLAVRALGLPAALISNTGITPGFVLRRILEDLDLLPLLDLLIFSDEVELAKPARAIFDQTLDEMGVAPGEAAFVGDQPRLDVMGARRAGMWSVQLGALAEDGIEPHARIGSLDELLPALRSLRLVD